MGIKKKKLLLTYGIRGTISVDDSITPHTEARRKEKYGIKEGNRKMKISSS